MTNLRLIFCVWVLTFDVALALEPPWVELACTTSDASYYYTTSRETKKISNPQQNFSIRSSSDKESEIFVRGPMRDLPTYDRNPDMWPFDDRPFRSVNFDYQNGLFVYVGNSSFSLFIKL